MSCGERRIHDGFVAFLHGADFPTIDRRKCRPFRARDLYAIDERLCGRRLRSRTDLAQQSFERSTVAEFDAHGVATDRTKQISWQRNMRMACVRGVADPAL